MKTKLTNKKLFYRVLIGLLFLMLVGFKYGILPTVNLRSEMLRIKDQLSSVGDAQQELKMIDKRLRIVKKQIGDFSESIDKGSLLIEEIGKICKERNLVLYEMPKKHSCFHEEFQIITYKIEVRGSYLNLIKLINKIEGYPSMGKLRSVKFEKQYDLKEKKEYLQCFIYIQTVIVLN